MRFHAFCGRDEARPSLSAYSASPRLRVRLRPPFPARRFALCLVVQQRIDILLPLTASPSRRSEFVEQATGFGQAFVRESDGLGRSA